MKTLYEIYDDIRNCKEVNNEELKLAVLMYRDLLWFANHDIEQIFRECGENPTIKMRYHQNVERYRKALKQQPEIWLGADSIPGTNDYNEKQEFCESLLKGYENWKKRKEK